MTGGVRLVQASPTVLVLDARGLTKEAEPARYCLTDLRTYIAGDMLKPELLIRPG